MSRIGLVFLIASLVLNFALIFFIINKPPLSKENRLSNTDFLYLSPRIFAENQNDILINFVALRNNLTNYGKDKSDLGIYFEYLPSGVSIGVNGAKSYVLASLLKVPLVMAVYKYIEKNQMSMNDVLTVKDETIDKNFGDFWKKGAGAKIRVKDAIDLALTKSDNTAANVLFDALPAGSLEDVFDSLDILKDREEENTVVTPKNYSSILRSLYLSSYLDEKYSNEILDLLTQSSFNDKLVAGVGKDVKVAHKIGVYNPDSPNSSIYTDCGIVYLPKRPYILCLMSRNIETSARNEMESVSTMVYDYVLNYNQQ